MKTKICGAEWRKYAKKILGVCTSGNKAVPLHRNRKRMKHNEKIHI